MDSWLTKAEAAAALGISTKTLERWEAAGKIIGEIRAGARWYERSAVQQLINNFDDSVRRKTMNKANPVFSTIAPYSFAVIDSRNPESVALLDQHQTLGVEMTIPALAAKCALGNIDPQHAGQNADLAAIEAALTCELPPTGTLLATLRADADAIGAMAVLWMRAAGVGRAIVSEQVRRIAAFDKFAKSPVWTPFDPDAQDWRINKLNVDIQDVNIDLGVRILNMANFLKGNDPNEEVLAALALAAWMIDRAKTIVKPFYGANAVYVESVERNATLIGYQYAPVVVAFNPSIKKFTVCQHASGYVDMVAVKERLSALEPGWGGQPNIIGSPIGQPSSLTAEQVKQVVLESIIRYSFHEASEDEASVFVPPHATAEQLAATAAYVALNSFYQPFSQIHVARSKKISAPGKHIISIAAVREGDVISDAIAWGASNGEFLAKQLEDKIVAYRGDHTVIENPVEFLQQFSKLV